MTSPVCVFGSSLLQPPSVADVLLSHQQTKTSWRTFRPEGLVNLKRVFFLAGEFTTDFCKLSWELSLVCHTVPGSLGSGNTAFIGIDLLYLGSLPLFRNASLVPCSLNLHILPFFYVDSRSVCSQLQPLSVELSGSSDMPHSSVPPFFT